LLPARRMRPALVVTCALLAGVAGGFASRLLPEARADTGVVLVPVPRGGVVFRGPAGNALVRIREGASGGVLEILDESEHTVVRLRAAPNGGSVDLDTARQRPAANMLPAGSVEDPGY
jgi:hypothetical protein